ncbi:MAG: tetratricopeptide repeat protein [Campylobacterota bacterium]|nr:tetratricopeptide repeat protein [Campylobacterota bacterium]
MKLIILLFLLIVSLNAKDLNTCYSVQLLSFPASQANSSSLDLPDTCQIITIGNSRTVRCGCKTDFKESQKDLLKYKTTYPKAMITTTYKYRFSTDIDKETQKEPIIPSKERPSKPIVKKPLKKISEKQTCYSIQLKSARNIKRTSSIKTVLDDGTCKILNLSGYEALRCGCYDQYAESKSEQLLYLEQFPKSMITTTYKYRFEDIDDSSNIEVTKKKIKKKSRKKYLIDTKPSSKDDEQLRLMYQVFTYSSDLNNSYIVAKKAVKKYPKSLYWHGKMAETSEWLDKRPEAIKHRVYIYNATHDEALGDEILTYALNSYQYVVAAPILKEKAEKDPSKKNINDLIFIYDKVGEPEVSAEVLENLYDQNTSDLSLLEEALRIYINLGEIDSSARVVEKISMHDSIDIDLAQLLSYYYFTKQDIEKSYAVLLTADISLKKDANVTGYYNQVSDLGWYLEDFNTSASASKILHERDEGRLVDYERILQYFDKDQELLQSAAHRGYQRYHKKYIFMTYLNILISGEKYDALANAYEEIRLNGEAKQFEGEAVYWLIKAEMHAHFKQFEKAMFAFHQALELEPDSTSILASYLWFLIDIEDQNNLRVVIFEIEEQDHIPYDLWLPLAVGHFQLQRSDRAYNYITMLIKAGSTNIDVKFLYAYIMQTREETDAFMDMMKTITEIMEAQKLKNPSLMLNPDFLERYLKAYMYFMPSDDFIELLEASKPILKPRSYTEISIFWALRHDEKERARFLAGLLTYVEPWMKLNMAIGFDSRTRQMDILYRYYSILPIRDRVDAAINTGQISFAQTLAFEGQRENKYDYLLYKQGKDLSEANVHKFIMQTGYNDRDTLEQYYAKAENRYYLMRAWTFIADAYIAENHNSDITQLATVPYYDRSIQAGLYKKFTRGYAEAKVGVRSAMADYSNYSLLVNYQLSSHYNLEVGYDKSARAEESMYLLLGGKKDMTSGRIEFQYLPSLGFALNLESNQYYSQDDYYLGKGYSGRIEWTKQIHAGYPDTAFGMYYDFGDYDEDSGYKGVIELLQPYRTKALPDNFYNIGMNFFYGTMNKDTYTRAWRPYAEFIPYYNGFADQFNFAVGAGYSGLAFDKDHMSFGFNYNQAVNGTQESLFELYLRYHMLY